VLFLFGSEYGPLFSAANRRVAAARERRSRSRQGSGLPARERRSTAALVARPLKSPKNNRSEASKVIMGEITARVSRPPEPPLQNSALDAALDRWKLAFEKAKATG
jgi:hypothetical protein